MYQDLVLGVGNRVKTVIQTKGPTQVSLTGPTACPVRLTPDMWGLLGS